MSILNGQSIFSTMLQNGPFQTPVTPLLSHPFSAENRAWIKHLNASSLLKTKYRLTRNQIFDLLDVQSTDEILTLIHSPQRRSKAMQRSHRLLGKMFSHYQQEEDIHRQLIEYAQTANDVIHSLQAKILAPYTAHTEITNEIAIMTEPIELLLAMYDDRFHQKARFEAKRKIALMSLAGSIDQREKETETNKKFAHFLSFLNEHVWSSHLAIGELESCYLYSSHAPDDFRCTWVDVLSKKQAAHVQVGEQEKLTLIKRRSFIAGNTEIPVYVTIRKKTPPAKVLKLLRKNKKNPAAAVDDDLGLMAVFNSLADVKRFLQHLSRSATSAGSLMTLEDISDTLSGGEYTVTTVGSSSKTPMLKFFARLRGIRVEFILHTNESYLNYIYQRDVAHDEYEVKRVFDSGVAEFLFPPDIYDLRLQEIRHERIAHFRKQAESNKHTKL